jgi:putative ABC transport system substrate-binding protein
MIAELVGRQVAVILAAGSAVALAAKAATATVPIVFTGGSDPVAIGLVASLNRPGGNVTGSTIISHQIGAKRLEVLRQLVPNAGLIALLIEAGNPSAETLGADTEAAARAIGLQTAAFAANSEASLEAAFAAMAQRQVNALFVGGGPLLGNLRQKTVALASRHGLPAMYSLREYVEVGGLMSYSSDFADSHRQAGAYAGRILKGERPADLPILQPTKFELVLNLKTAKALGLAVPDKLLALADEVIE